MHDTATAPGPAARPASGTVHWLGAGLSTGRGLAVTAAAAEHTFLWARDTGKAQACLDRLSLAERVQPQRLERAALAARLRPGDVVVSMLPATEHENVLNACVDADAHFACSSYTSAEVAKSALAAADRGLVVLTEAGLDPGIDHLLAHALVDSARTAAGDGSAPVWFGSHCGGIPAEANEFRYRFSWAPRGVLHALRQPARYIRDGVVREAAEPWEHTREMALVEGGEIFEVYPNRDSLPFLEQYALPPAWQPQEFIRGTVRLNGWQAAWRPVFEVLRTGDDARIDELADELAKRYPAGPADHDRVVLAVTLRVGNSWSGGYLMDVCGDDAESAMSRCVSLPLAVGIQDILSGRMAAGLNRAAADPATARQWLARLVDLGLDIAAVA